MSETTAPAESKAITSQAFGFDRAHRAIYALLDKNGEVLMEGSLQKSLVTAEYSNQKSRVGIQPWPVDYEMVDKLFEANTYHSICIQAKVSASIGLGFMTPEAQARKLAGEPVVMPFEVSKAEKALNPLCRRSWQETLAEVAHDYWNPCNGYLEIVRQEPKQNAKMTGVHPLPATKVRIEVENDNNDYHFMVMMDSGTEVRFAAFGDLDDFIKRRSLTGDEAAKVSEVIHFKGLVPAPGNRWYAYPDWISCVPKIELSQCVDQKEFDFYLNRGVPEFMLFITGGQVDDDTWKEIKKAVKANIGMGNSSKSIAVNLVGGQFKVEVVKLGLDSKGADDYSPKMDAIASAIVSAHRVPPVLAGINIPGKLGANNELPNAILAFQLLVIGPGQRQIQQTLAVTLGDPTLNGGLGLVPEDFVLVQLMDAMNLNAMATLGGMKQTFVEGQSQGRDLNQGLKQ